jgi:release factor glutamine methyltransferase
MPISSPAETAMPAETVEALIIEFRSRLARAGIASAGLDARVLVLEALKLDRVAAIAEPKRKVEAAALRRARGHLERRLAGEPVSRILGRREFYGREFRINPATLDPRPDTETVVEAALRLLAGVASPSILDLGTGSGAIMVTLLCEIAAARGVATDCSAAALEAAADNARRLGVAERAQFVLADWLDGVEGRFDLVASNPPYIKSGDLDGLEIGVKDHDPLVALDGGEEGVDAYRRIAAHVGRVLKPGGAVVLEIGNDQRAAVQAIFGGHGLFPPEMGEAVVKDLAGRDRVVVLSA